jgi:hypothetical protein
VSFCEGPRQRRFPSLLKKQGAALCLRPHRSEEEQAGEDLVEQAITRLVFMEAGASVEELTSQGLRP